MVNIRFFASLREQLQQDTLSFSLSGQKTVADIVIELQKDDKTWLLLSEKEVLVAVNHTLCSINTEVKDGDEVAFFPPVTGG